MRDDDDCTYTVSSIEQYRLYKKRRRKKKEKRRREEEKRRREGRRREEECLQLYKTVSGRMEVHLHNLPRFLLPLFVAGSLAFAMTSALDLTWGLAVPAALFLTVQLQNFGIV